MTESGYAYDYKPSSDLVYKLDTSTMLWSSIDARGTRASTAVAHSATLVGTKMFVLEGNGTTYCKVRLFDTETNRWLDTPQPPDKHWYTYCFTYDGELWVLSTNSCLLRFNPETLSWKTVEPKGKGPGSSIAHVRCCTVGDRTVCFGGYERYLSRFVGPPSDELYVLDLSPSLKTLCKLEVIKCYLERTELPRDIRWELAAMTAHSN